jgi:hypothetical protein
MDTPRITRAMATRERRIPPLLRQLGTVRHADFRRDDDAFIRSNPETVRQLLEARREIAEGKGIPFTLEELRADLGLL